MASKIPPTVGRIVHYGYVRNVTSTSGPVVTHQEPLVECAAIITKVLPKGLVNLHVFLPNGLETRGVQDAAFFETLKEGFWTWPPKA